MNNFVVIERIKEFDFSEVKYFSVRFKENKHNEFVDFLTRMEKIPEIENDLNNMLAWIEEIGESTGAIRDIYFRNEAIISQVSALPPPRKKMKVNDIPVEDLRLYCFVANEHVVFLFNGGIKTQNKAQHCPNVGPYIKQANIITNKLEELFKSNEIRWNRNYTDISYTEGEEIEL